MHEILLQAPILLIFLAIAYFVAFTIYALYFHPLSRFPGPKTWILSRVPLVLTLRAGKHIQKVAEFHKKYGPIVRTGYNDMSFIAPEAWNDIYSTKAGFEKNPIWMFTAKNGVKAIITASKNDHARYRRLMAHGFSDKALRAQEPIIQKYISLFLAKLREEMGPSSETRPINLTKWYEYVIFDLLGDLSFSRSFHSMEDSTNRPFVSAFIQNIQAITHIITSNYIPALRPLISLAIPKGLKAANAGHFTYVRSLVRARVAEGDDESRPDFMSYLRRYNTADDKGMSMPEIESNFATILIAGSETNATAMTGITNELMRNPRIYKKLVEEIRGTFASETDITAASTLPMPYLNAVIEEALRYCVVSPGFGSRVVPPQGGAVCGHWLPGGTFVHVPQYSCFHSPLNFSEPEEFMPERWIDPEKMEIHNAAALNPFSLGNRNCIGKYLAYVEIRLILARILFNFDIISLGNEFKWADQKAFLLWEKRPFEIALKPAKT